MVTVETVVDRMRLVMKLKGWSESDWARAAELKERSNVNKLLVRMAKDPTRLAGDVNTFAKLANAAGVSLDWLALGVGVPTPDVVSFAKDPHYPTRARVLIGAFLMGFDRQILDAVLAHNEPAADPGWEYWLRLLQLKEAELSASSGAAPPQLGQ